MQGTIHVTSVPEDANVSGRVSLVSGKLGAYDTQGGGFDNSGVANRRMSDDGRYVVFASPGTGIAAVDDALGQPVAVADTNGARDVFWRDRVLGITRLVIRRLSRRAAKRKLVAAGCRLGKVTVPARLRRSRHLVVVKQRPAAGRNVATRTRVRIRLGRAR